MIIMVFIKTFNKAGTGGLIINDYFVCLSYEGLALLDSKMAIITGPRDVSEEPRGADSLPPPLCPPLPISHLGSI